VMCKTVYFIYILTLGFEYNYWRAWHTIRARYVVFSKAYILKTVVVFALFV
jgi:hypothetical protein